VNAAPRTPAIFGCAGTRLRPDEAAFFARVAPIGYILFARNCAEPDQVRALIEELRSAGSDPAAPVLIDQEGGRVARLRPPYWRLPPPARAFGDLYVRHQKHALEACRLNARLMAHDLAALGIDVDCVPVLDVPVPGSHDIIGDRAFAADVATIVALARAQVEGLIEGGVLPVIKHIPGHGRARSDTHDHLPVVEASAAELAGQDFAPFRALADLPLAMTAHVVYSAIDAVEPATTSRPVIEDVIRRHIGFSGALMTDDLSMKALAGPMERRAERALAAGCDIVLHCNGELAEMEAVAAGAASFPAASRARIASALARRGAARPFDAAAARERLAALLAPSA
jgi:beta-N-acetylhexosaminidase